MKHKLHHDHHAILRGEARGRGQTVPPAADGFPRPGGTGPRGFVLLLLLAGACTLLPGCQQINREDAATLVEVARGLGADVEVRGELGPARFGPSFQADLGARLTVEGRTDTGAVTARDLLETNRQLLELVGQLSSEE